MMCSLRHGCHLRECPANVPPVDLLIGGHGYVSRLLYVGSRSTVVAYIVGTVAAGKNSCPLLDRPLPLAALAWQRIYGKTR